MIYKLLRQGRIPASKIGRIWRFNPELVDQWLLREAGLPRDYAAKTTKSAISESLDDFAKTLKKKLGAQLKGIILYGSWARGDNQAGSDVDLLIVLEKIKDRWKTLKIVEDVAYQCTFEKNRLFVFSCILMEETNYLTGISPLLLNIRKEGRRAA